MELGGRSLGWDFSRHLRAVVEIRRQEGKGSANVFEFDDNSDSEGEEAVDFMWLKRLASVLSRDSDVSHLSNWDLWENAKVTPAPEPLTRTLSHPLSPKSPASKSVKGMSPAVPPKGSPMSPFPSTAADLQTPSPFKRSNSSPFPKVYQKKRRLHTKP